MYCGTYQRLRTFAAGGRGFDRQEEVASFCAVQREKLLDTSQPFSKEYLQLLVNEIVLTGNSVTVKGGYIPLVGAVKFTEQKKKLSTPQEILSFNSDWRPLADALRIFFTPLYIASVDGHQAHWRYPSLLGGFGNRIHLKSHRSLRQEPTGD